MGKKKLSWRDILLIVALGVTFLGVLIPLIINWDWTEKQLKSIWYLYLVRLYLIYDSLKFLFLTTEGRQIVLSLLVIGIVVWLVFFEKRFKKLIKKVEAVPSFDVAKYKNEIVLKGEHKVILKSLMRYGGSSTTFGLEKEYEKFCGKTDSLDFNIYIDDLVEAGYIRFLGDTVQGFKAYSLTRAGTAYVKELRKKDEEPPP